MYKLTVEGILFMFVCLLGGGSCSHIVGLVQALHQWQLMGFTSLPTDLSCTSLPQQWSKPRGHKIESEPVPALKFVNAKPDRKRLQFGTNSLTAESAVLSDACADSGDCSVTNAHCSSNVCVCENNYVVSSDGLSCEMVTGLDGTCTLNASCATTKNAVCSFSKQSGICVCGSGYVKTGLLCKSELGNRCLQKSDCHDKNAMCTNNTCVCKSNNFDSDDQGNIGGICILKKKLDESCPSGVLESEPCADLNARCVSGTCQCLSTHYDSNGVGAGNLGGICKPKVMLDRICPQPSTYVPDTATCFDTQNRCIWTGYSYYCKCLDSHYKHSNGVCTPKEELGRLCPHTVASTETCSDANARCTSGLCLCLSIFYDSNGIGTVGGTCLPKVNLNGDCPTDIPNTEPCSDSNAKCTAEGTCECISTHYDDNRNDTPGGTCRAKTNRLKTTCPVADACLTTNVVCQGSRCVCEDAFFDDNGGIYGSCRIKIPLNQTCSPYGYLGPCSDGNAKCKYPAYICVCKTGYSESEGKCIPNQSIGDECRTATTGECSDGNADCINNTCVCNTLSYDDNGLSESGNCRPMIRLQVSGVVTSDPQTTGFTVKWTAPIKSEHVSGYTVQWWPKDNSLSGDSVDVGNETSYVVGSGVIAGKVYVVKIISRNEITQVNSPRTVDSKAVEQAAEPGSPEQLFCDPTIVDATYGRINLNWTLSTGVASQYIVKLLDGTRELAKRSFLSPQGYIYFNNMLDGHSYNISVTALSEHVYSKTLIKEIKTVVKEPGSPTNVQCEAEFEDTIRLAWFKPRFPKGTIGQYYINVKNRDSSTYSSHRTGSSSTIFDIGGLQPGSYYTFEVITENESYNSSTANQVCTTEARTSDAPTELTITDVTTRSVSFEWNTPTNTYSEEILGYVIQVIDESDNCAVELIYKCYGCFKTFQVGDLQNLCNYQASTRRRSKAQLSGKQVYTATGLMPYTPYTVSVSAINLADRGQDATEIQKTKAEEPGPPTSVKCVQEFEDTIRLTWLQPVLINGGHIKQYHIIVKQRDSSTYSSHKTNSSTTMMDIGGLQPGSYYRVEVITENESFNSSRTGATAGFCTTKARTSDAPSDFTITNVNSASITLEWSYPVNIYSEEMLGYIIQVKNESDECAVEIIYKCSDCFKTFQVGDLQNLCNYQVLTEGKTKAQLSVKQVYNAVGLMPYTAYTVSVSAINLAGRGQDATEIQKTKAEEAQAEEQLKENGTTAIVVGVVLGVLVMCVLVAVVVFMLVRRAGTLRRKPEEDVALSERTISQPPNDPSATSVPEKTVYMDLTDTQDEEESIYESIEPGTSDRVDRTFMEKQGADHAYQNISFTDKKN